MVNLFQGMTATPYDNWRLQKMKKLNYNYHDSLIDKVKITETTFTFYVDLYSIYYPSKPKVKLSFNLIDKDSNCKDWTNLLFQTFDKQEHYLGARLDDIKIKYSDINSKTLLCTIECDHMDILNFQSLSFKETEIKREIHIDEQLFSICGEILKENLTLEEWTEIESDDMFQTENYEGGFDGIEKSFVFSFYDDYEYWFQITLQQVKEISNGQLKYVFAIQSDYYND